MFAGPDGYCRFNHPEKPGYIGKKEKIIENVAKIQPIKLNIVSNNDCKNSEENLKINENKQETFETRKISDALEKILEDKELKCLGGIAGFKIDYKNDKDNGIIILMDEVNKYKIEDIIAFYNDKPNILFSWKENLARQYYIIEKYNEQEIIFLIINDNNDFIIDFSYILKEDFNKIKGLKFCKGNGMGYPIASPILKSLHEIIWGKES